MTIPKSISDDENLLSPSQVAKELGVHRSTVHVWIKGGMLKTERHGVFLSVSREEVERFRKLYDIAPPPKRRRRKKGK